mgnify:FL=1
MENDSYCPLSAIREGQQATVETLLATDSMRRRLLDIGLVAGTKVTCLQKSPAGDPVAYLIRGAVIAIRSEDAERILVTPQIVRCAETVHEQGAVSWG